MVVCTLGGRGFRGPGLRVRVWGVFEGCLGCGGGVVFRVESGVHWGLGRSGGRRGCWWGLAAVRCGLVDVT